MARAPRQPDAWVMTDSPGRKEGAHWLVCSGWLFLSLPGAQASCYGHEAITELPLTPGSSQPGGDVTQAQQVL